MQTTLNEHNEKYIIVRAATSLPDFYREWWISMDQGSNRWRISEFTYLPSRFGDADEFKR